MVKNIVYPAQLDTQSFGKFQINVTSDLGFIPINNAKISISYTSEPDKVLEVIQTNNSGQTNAVELESPPLEYSMEPGNEQPYSEYTVKVEAEGYDPITVAGNEILAEQTALLEVSLTPLEEVQESGHIVIPPHTLYGSYPPKIAEAEIKPMAETGEIVLSRVVIPEYVIVHDGTPADTTATNHYVKYKDYIKNVASSEIYATWPESTIQANVLAIMSFTLNRVYTEWYRNQGYNFTITSSTAFDHKWMYGRNIYKNISAIVDTIFTNFLSRPNVRQPILTQYCDGQTVQCPQWMTQWGSKYLGDQGYNPIEIIRYFYGDNMYINSAEQISGVPSSWPGSNLVVGSSGDKVRQMQSQINTIATAYPQVPKVRVDGQFGNETKNAVTAIQRIFGLPQTGIVDYPTWYKISEIYTAVSRIAELV